MANTCECGCGQELDPVDKYGRPRRFISGHNKKNFNEKRFWDRVQKTDTCWLWVGYRIKEKTLPNKSKILPYGMLRIQGKQVLAHRTMFKLVKGEIPEGMMVLHTCDVPYCVNPDHLYLGTQQDNMNDMKNRGRRVYKHNASDL